MRKKKQSFDLRLILAQENATVGDLRGNADKVLESVSQAKEWEADLIVFPELFLAGYPPEDLLLHPAFVSDNLVQIKELSRQIEGIIAIVGFVDRDAKGNLYNAAALILNRRLAGVIHKICLPNYGVFDEKRYFTPGDLPTLLSLGEISIGINICEDIWVPDGPVAVQAKSGGAKLLINLSASPFHSGKVGLREKVLRDHAKQHHLYMSYTNLVGGQDELVFDGTSMVVGPSGRLLAMAPFCQEELLVVDIPWNELRVSRKKAKQIHRISIPGFVPTAKTKKITRWVSQRPERLAEIYQALVLGTRDYVRKNGFEKVVIGLSGGIDSALTAVIAAEALGKENVIGATLPSLFSSMETKTDARIVAENLGITFVEIPIHAIFQSYLETLKPVFEGTKPDIAEENIQARIRGNLLMALSNKLGWLVLTTGNKSEFSTGYCTLYGDMSGGFAVIKDVPKTLVYELAQYRNRKGTSPVIPQTILDRLPTAELKPNQTDQDTLPPYGLLDQIIEAYVEQDKSLEQVVRKVDRAEIVQKMIRMIDGNEYKRRQAPPGIKITPRAFGKDRRFPITNRYRSLRNA